MTLFEKFFGVSPTTINENCIICPSQDAALFFTNKLDSKAQKGVFAQSIDCGFATVISTKYNLLVGDIVLLLKQTKCKNIFLFGSCGAPCESKIGASYLIEKAYSADSFTQMLNMDCASISYYATPKLFNKLKVAMPFVEQANCLTVASLVLEKEYLNSMEKNEISCVDMEASIVFAAAQKVGISVSALFYVTDTIEAQLTAELSQSEKVKLANSRKKLATALTSFIKNV